VNLESILESPVVELLAVIGLVALLLRLGRALLALGLAAAEQTAASGLAEVSARRGDLTGMAERQADEQRLRRARLRAVLLAMLWAALLVVPPIADFARAVYALSAALWFLPQQRLRLTRLPARNPQP
jgi:hypothetical protein